jgi:carbamoyl-phosphate synthase large subunit
MHKALRGLEIDRDGLTEILDLTRDDTDATLRKELSLPGSDRLWYVADAFRYGFSFEEVQSLTHIDPWFLVQVHELVTIENDLKQKSLAELNATEMFALKRKGFSDSRLAKLLQKTEKQVRDHRQNLNVRPVYKRVDTCAAEFASSTAYMYSSYDQECEAAPSDREKIMILGGGPNRIGQGIEFDYCCVHAALSLRDDGYETIMVNCNPETVSTDYDTSDRLYFESLTLEDVLEIVDLEKPKGVIVQYGGQTPLKLARALEANGVPIIGTSPDAIDHAEDRERFQQMVEKLNLLQPPNRLASSSESAVTLAAEIGYPLVVRPSYVLGGRAMEIVYNEDELSHYMKTAVQVSNDSPVLLDRFLDDAIEVDVDCICDGKDVLIGGIMEHIEQAGVHSGDSACALPPYSLSEEIKDRLREQVRMMAMELGVVGLMNTQFAIKGEEIYILEVNPRASRTVPYVSKSIGVPLAKVAASCMAGKSLAEQGVTEEVVPDYYSVKEAVFPFIKFQGVDPILGPEMKSTGEVMGVGRTFGEAFAKSQLAASVVLPTGGKAFISVREVDKDAVVSVAKELLELGFELLATRGTQAVLAEAGLSCEKVNKVAEGQPHIVDMIKNDEIDLIVNTTEGRQSVADSREIRRAALQHQVNYTTTLAATRAMVQALHCEDNRSVNRLQALHGEL